MQNFKERSQELKSELINIRRFLHENAECGNNLPITTKYVIDKLKEFGLNPEEICKSGVVATIKGGKPGKTILLRADMDALPMEENTNLPFASKTNCAHTCGHDLHTTMLLGAAKMLFECRENLKGNVKFMFQPAEETFEGSKDMIDNGIMKNPTVEAAIDFHVNSELIPGVIAYRNDYPMSSCDGFEIIIKGKGSHGAYPHMGIDPINVGAHLHLALQELISRETPPDKIAVLTICQFESGNTANIIPEIAKLKGTMRTFDKELRTKLKERFKEIVKYTAKTFGAEIEINVLSDVPAMSVDSDMVDNCIKHLEELDYGFTFMKDFRGSGSDDFSRISELVPSVFLAVGAGPYNKEEVYPHHNPNIVFNEESLPMGAAIFAQGAFKWLENN